MATRKKVLLTPLNMQRIQLHIRGRNLMINRFSLKAQIAMQEKQAEGATSHKAPRGPKDFEELYEMAKYVSADGWCGFNATSLRRAGISACRAANFVMTRAKLAIFVEEDGYDLHDGTPLVRITNGEPHMDIRPVWLTTGVVDLRARPLWTTWEAKPVIRFDADMFTAADIINLYTRVGIQVGIGEGRHDSKKSDGIGFGTFDLVHPDSDDNEQGEERNE